LVEGKTREKYFFNFKKVLKVFLKTKNSKSIKNQKVEKSENF
jgi:hypothetical protein